MNANKATAGLAIDIWNEPDYKSFWTKSQSQYLQMWGRTYHRLRAEWPDVLLIGPAASAPPSTSSACKYFWDSHLSVERLTIDLGWTSYMKFVATNASIPDQWVWHMERRGGDMGTAHGGLLALLKAHGLPDRPINIDEYAVSNEQVPAGSAWWISQLERANAIGLRGNWASGFQLHDYLASLLSKPNAGTSKYSPTQAGYFPNGDYQVYKYYNLNMTGHRVGTAPSADLLIDTYATVSSTTVKILTGVKTATGTWQVTVNELSAVGLPTSGTLKIQTWGFTFAGHYGEVDGPKNLGVVSHTYSGNSVTFPIFQNDTTTGYAFEFAI